MWCELEHSIFFVIQEFILEKIYIMNTFERINEISMDRTSVKTKGNEYHRPFQEAMQHKYMVSCLLRPLNDFFDI